MLKRHLLNLLTIFLLLLATCTLIAVACGQSPQPSPSLSLRSESTGPPLYQLRTYQVPAQPPRWVFGQRWVQLRRLYLTRPAYQYQVFEPVKTITTPGTLATPDLPPTPTRYWPTSPWSH